VSPRECDLDLERDTSAYPVIYRATCISIRLLAGVDVTAHRAQGGDLPDRLACELTRPRRAATGGVVA